MVLSIASSSVAKDVSSLFYVSKSDNRNQAHYGVQLNQKCLPTNSRPVYAYWRMANGKTEELLSIEEPAYGIASQSVSGNNTNLILNGFQNRGIQRMIALTASGSNGRCQAKAYTNINGVRKELSYIHIDLADVRRNPFGGGTIGGRVVRLTLISSDGTQEAIPCSSNCRFGI
ncbi:MAG: DUF4833 domain-containing protein [Tildeniella nuda ZEHNDER 1965/U140]|nr:DUF4833 domain-containing protein [Tildeniella nuda ZEHNDER 1965/U140]